MYERYAFRVAWTVECLSGGKGGGLKASALAIRAKSRPRARSTSGIRVDNNLLIELKKRKDERAPTASSRYGYLNYSPTLTPTLTPTPKDGEAVQIADCV